MVLCICFGRRALAARSLIPLCGVRPPKRPVSLALAGTPRVGKRDGWWGEAQFGDLAIWEVATDGGVWVRRSGGWDARGFARWEQ